MVLLCILGIHSLHVFTKQVSWQERLKLRSCSLLRIHHVRSWCGPDSSSAAEERSTTPGSKTSPHVGPGRGARLGRKATHGLRGQVGAVGSIPTCWGRSDSKLGASPARVTATKLLKDGCSITVAGGRSMDGSVAKQAVVKSFLGLKNNIYYYSMSHQKKFRRPSITWSNVLVQRITKFHHTSIAYVPLKP